MAKLIVKSPYLSTEAKANSYMEYIATREGVEYYMKPYCKPPRCGEKGGHRLFGDEDRS